MCEEARSILDLLQSPFLFESAFSLGPGSPISLGWLVWDLEGSTCLCLPSSRIKGVHCHARLSLGHMDGLRFSRLYDKHIPTELSPQHLLGSFPSDYFNVLISPLEFVSSYFSSG